MGMSDVTCAVSHLPIQDGDPCRFLFLRRSVWADDESSCFHPGSKWIVASLPVTGKYDGYGRVEDFTDDAVTRLQVEALSRRALPLQDDELSGFADAEGYPNTIASLMWACKRGLLRLELPRSRGEGSTTVDTAPLYVREDAYQAVIADSDRDPPGVGIWRARLRKHRTTDPVDRLRAMVVREQCAAEVPPDARRIHQLLDEARALTGDGLASHMEETPDVMVCGTDFRLDVTAYPSLLRFTDDDWRKLSEAVFDLEVFYRTMRVELRRELHPVLYRDQFYFPEQGLDAHRMLARYVERWCLEIEAKSQNEENE